MLLTVTLPGPLVDAQWLAEDLGRPGLVVAHVGWSASGGTSEALKEFQEGHIPGAIFLDVDRDLAARPFEEGPGRHPLPRPEVFAQTMSAAGVGDGTDVVAYDSQGGSLAARLWWMLDATGRSCALLDGGLRSWTGRLEEGPSRTRPRASFSARPWPAERIVDAERVDRAKIQGVVIDVRAAERYSGETEPIDPVGGHIPGAVNHPWTGNLGADGRFLDPPLLRERYEALGAADGEAVFHCGSGVTACHGLFALRLAGLPDAKLYEGSWSDWIRDGTRPVARGSEAPGS